MIYKANLRKNRKIRSCSTFDGALYSASSTTAFFVIVFYCKVLYNVNCVIVYIIVKFSDSGNLRRKFYG